MGLETGVTYIDDLVETNPIGSTDTLDEADNHLRIIKVAVKGSFPSLGSAAVTKTAAQINNLAEKSAPATTNNLAMLDAGGDLADSLVETDGAGNITANVTGDLTGNADTATVAGTITSQGALATLDTVSETEIDTDAITQSKIKTIGTGTYAGSLGNGIAVQLTLNAYCFFPMIHTTASGGASETIVVTGHTTDGASPDNARFGLLNTGTGGTETYDVDYRYITT